MGETTSQSRDELRRLDDYELGETIQTGTHTITRRATLPGIQRPFLIKSLKPGIRPSADVLRTLERERDALCVMDHPNLAGMVEAISDGDHIALVFPDHCGHRLDRILDQAKPIEPLAAIAITIAIASALGAIHHAGDAHGFLHAEMVEITDRGAVLLHGHGAPGSAGHADDDETLMVPKNMAPEQLLGDDADSSTDVFHLGTLLFHMVAGRRPFDAEGTNISQAIRHDAPLSLGGRGLNLPDGLPRVINRCLRKRRQDRYPDVGSVSSELLHMLHGSSSLPSEVLITRVLARAGLAEAIPPPLERGPEAGTARARQWLQKLAAPIATTVAVLALAALLWQSFRDPPIYGSTDPRGIVKRPARLRILAHPWAAVHIDGKLKGVTPIGRPIEVVPGRHDVVFKHPNAPEQTRSVDIIAGQTILLDIEMQVVRLKDAAAPDAAPIDPSP